jgi:predicted transcriptional regulator
MVEHNILSATTAIVSSYALHSPPTHNPAELIVSVYSALLRCETAASRIRTGGGRLDDLQDLASPQRVAEPAVPISEMSTKEGVACLVCGRRLQMLKRHLLTEHDLSPDEYRARYGLPSNSPLTSEDYSRVRSDLAIASGLGRKRGKRGR